MGQAFLVQQENTNKYLGYANILEKFIREKKANAMQQSSIEQYFNRLITLGNKNVQRSVQAWFLIILVSREHSLNAPSCIVLQMHSPKLSVPRGAFRESRLYYRSILLRTCDVYLSQPG